MPAAATQTGSIVALLIAHGRFLPDLDEGEPLADDTEWTCNECADTIGIGQDFETYAAEHQVRVLAAHGYLVGTAPAAVDIRSHPDFVAVVEEGIRQKRRAIEAERALKRTEGVDTITVPRPHVPHGPQGVPVDQADADYLREAARKLAEHYKPFGSNLRATVVKLLNDVANAIARAGEPADPRGAR